MNFCRNKQRKLSPSKTCHETEENFVWTPGRIKYTQTSISGHGKPPWVRTSKDKNQNEQKTGRNEKELIELRKKNGRLNYKVWSGRKEGKYKFSKWHWLKETKQPR